MSKIVFTSGYRYQLTRGYRVCVPGLSVPMATTHRFLTGEGADLAIHQGYAWDGPSGVPGILTHVGAVQALVTRMLRASLEHDALYQLIRVGGIPASDRLVADQRFRDTCLADGLPAPLAWLAYRLVRQFGARAATAAAERPEQTAGV